MEYCVNYVYDFLFCIKWDTFWSAVSAIATLAAIRAIYVGIDQLKFDTWNQCQSLFTEESFRKNRKILFFNIDKSEYNWKKKDLDAALKVAGNMDALCRLARFFGEKEMLNVWGNPIAKAWILTESIIVKERTRTKWADKWNAFERLGTSGEYLISQSDITLYKLHATNLGRLYDDKYKTK